MDKLSKESIARKEALQARLRQTRLALVEKQEEANDLIRKINKLMSDAFADYGSVIEEANALREELHEEMSTTFDDRSEKWQDGDKGIAYGEWRDAWDQEMETPEFDELDELDLSDFEGDEHERDFNDDDYPNEPQN